MRAWRVEAWGEPEAMELRDVPIPDPGPGQVLIRNRAVSLNFFDVLQIQGKYQVKPAFPFTPGAELAGEVEATGTGVKAFRVGDRVVGAPMLGALAEYTVCAERHVFPMARQMSWSEGAALPIVYQTSFFALRDRGNLRYGEWLLVHAGASGVGMSAIQIGRAWGARVIATASSEEKLAFARAQGAEIALSYSDPQWVEEVKQITGMTGPGVGGADVIYDPVGGDVFDQSTKCIAPGGRLLVVGFASGRIPSIAANRILLKNMSVVGVLWGNHVMANESYARDTHAELSRMYEAGQIRPVIAQSLRLEEAVRGMRAFTGRQVMGKVVVEL
ncbi:MAG: NADPH:quinone oxidoreductase family protein [Bryobacteraceae bacterium]